MPPTKGRNSRQLRRESCPDSKPRSSGAPITSKASPFCPSAGSSSAPLPGSIAAEGLPRIGKTSIARPSHSCASPQSASCSESFAIQLNVPGQTLRARLEFPSPCEREIAQKPYHSKGHVEQSTRLMLAVRRRRLLTVFESSTLRVSRPIELVVLNCSVGVSRFAVETGGVVVEMTGGRHEAHRVAGAR